MEESIHMVFNIMEIFGEGQALDDVDLENLLQIQGNSISNEKVEDERIDASDSQ